MERGLAAGPRLDIDRPPLGERQLGGGPGSQSQPSRLAEVQPGARRGGLAGRCRRRRLHRCGLQRRPNGGRFHIHLKVHIEGPGEGARGRLDALWNRHQTGRRQGHRRLRRGGLRLEPGGGAPRELRLGGRLDLARGALDGGPRRS
ncbi:MAG TPA: hypothetical protein VIA06_16520 [Candidatus Dormibacteraeota bacterium]|nr:hypothetical protein [Candidatus Dormibacteraeota bacterium]